MPKCRVCLNDNPPMVFNFRVPLKEEAKAREMAIEMAREELHDWIDQVEFEVDCEEKRTEGIEA